MVKLIAGIGLFVMSVLTSNLTDSAIFISVGTVLVAFSIDERIKGNK